MEIIQNLLYIKRDKLYGTSAKRYNIETHNIVNQFLARKIKKIDMVSSLKGNE